MNSSDHTVRADLVRLKCSLIARGVRLLSDDVAALAAHGVKAPESVRSGSSGGLDTRIAGLAVNVPIADVGDTDAWALRIERSEGAVVSRAFLERGGLSYEVELLREPEFYSRVTSGGTRMREIGHVCFDRLGIVALRDCEIWNRPELRCRFCGYGANVSREAPARTDEELIETVEAAERDPLNPVRHILLTGGGALDVDRELVPEMTRLLRLLDAEHRDVGAMLPAVSRESIRALADAGISEMAMNIEVWDRELAREIVPWKAQLGRERYLDALRCAAETLGPRKVRSLLVLGAESERSVLEGVRHIAASGAMPVLSPFRRVSGSRMGAEFKPDESWLAEIYWQAREVALQEGGSLAPVCEDCQCNTLSFPWDAEGA